MPKLLLTLLVGAFAFTSMAPSALAIKQFSDEFMKLYKVDKSAADKSDFAEAVLDAKCYTCHQGKKKKDRNPYGMELAVLLDKKKDAKNPKKIIEALEKVAKVHVDPKDEKSPTYGDLIKAGKLPGGSVEECKKKPEERWPDGAPKPSVTASEGSDKKGSAKK